MSDLQLPNFLIVGAMRSGTTSLFAGLRTHPALFLPPKKELRFFDVNFDRGLDWYAGFFSGGGSAVARGEASQTYMYDGSAFERMASTLPDARLIAILRDPVDRAYSHYWLNRARSREPLGFAAAIDAEAERLRHASPTDRFFYSYVDRGRYIGQLDRLLSKYERSRLLVLLFDDLLERPSETFAAVHRFLGVEEQRDVARSGRAVNAFQGFRSLRVRDWTKGAERLGMKRAARLLGAINRRRETYPPMEPQTRARLGRLFLTDNVALGRLLERDLSSWAGLSVADREAAG